MVEINFSQDIQKSYEVIFNITVKAHIHWNYVTNLYTFLKRHALELKPSAYFLIDTHDAHLDYVALCLMRLLDFTRGSHSLKYFLEKLRSEARVNSDLVKKINEYLSDINEGETNKIREKIKHIRNKKYAHIDYQNTTGKFAPGEEEVFSNDIEFLLDKIKKMVCNFSTLFNKNFDSYISSSNLTNEIFNALKPVFCYDN